MAVGSSTMIDQGRTDSKLPPETVAALLLAALRVQKHGNRAGARALLHALAAQQPDEPRVWLALATVAETNAEQREALERLIALDPQHPLAQRAAEYLGRRGLAVTPPVEVAPPGGPPSAGPAETYSAPPRSEQTETV